MITIEEAERILRGTPVSLEPEEVPLGNSLNRILAQSISSTMDMPPFDRSAMDGYAVNSEGNPEYYRIVEILPAGETPRVGLRPGECCKLMTGAMLPEGADRVVKVESAVEEAGVMRIVKEEENRNIRYRGEDFKAGEVLLERGVRIRPAEIALIASLGIATVSVFKKPVVGLITTGSELVDPGRPLQPGQIYNSNALSICAQIQEASGEIRYLGTVPDSRVQIREAIWKLLPDCDMVILSGGVSAGDYDYVPDVLKEIGVNLHFQKVAVQPGMPTVFGTRGGKVFFGLPGNPVSTFVIFEIFIRPVLYRMMGHEWNLPIIRAHLREGYIRRNPARAAFVPILYRDGVAHPVRYLGSAHLEGLCNANGLMLVPLGIREIPAGAEVDMRLI